MARREGRSDRMQTRHPVVIAKRVECALAHTGHDAHVCGDVRRVGELYANMGDRRTERTHAEWNHVHRATSHRCGEEPGHFFAHIGWITPVVVRASIDRVCGADERAVFDACDVTRVGVRPIAVRSFGFIELGEGAGVHECLAEPLVFICAAVAPIDAVRRHDRGPLVDPLLKTRVATCAAH